MPPSPNRPSPPPRPPPAPHPRGATVEPELVQGLKGARDAGRPDRAAAAENQPPPRVGAVLFGAFAVAGQFASRVSSHGSPFVHRPVRIFTTLTAGPSG